MAERANKINRLLDRYLGIPLVRLTSLARPGAVCPRSLRSGTALGSDAPERIGIICLGAIGDLLLLTTLTKALAQRFPQARICLLTTKANAGAVPLIPGIGEHAAFPVRHLPQMLAWLRRHDFDLLIDTSQWARVGAVLSNLSGAKRTVGFDTPGQARAAGYDLAVPHRNDRHETANFLALGQALFPDLTGAPELILPEERPEGLPESEAPGTDTTAPSCIYLHLWPSGGSPWLKEWPAQHWAELAQELLRQGFHLRLTGSLADAPRNEAFLQAYFPAQKKTIASLAGKTPLPALAWLLARAQGVVSVNTGIMHLAALCGAPTIGLHGATNPLRWGPVGPSCVSLLPRQGDYAYLNLGFEYPQGAASSLPWLPVADVLEALRTLRVLGH